jgi:hypothetical protein
MKIKLFIISCFVFNLLSAQFTTESQVASHMSGKDFYNESYQMTVSYEFLPTMNTYGIKCVNSSGEKFYYINCSIRPYGSSADINGTDPYNGKSFGFRVYDNRISVQGEDFYRKGTSNSSSSSTNSSNSPTTTTSPTLARYGVPTKSYAEIAREHSKSGSNYSKPTTTEEIKKFQDWLDSNYPGWVNGKSLNKGTGYGSWGPSTKTAWEKYGSKYEKK